MYLSQSKLLFIYLILQIIKEAKQHDDMAELAKLFDLHGEPAAEEKKE